MRSAANEYLVVHELSRTVLLFVLLIFSSLELKIFFKWSVVSPITLER